MAQAVRIRTPAPTDEVTRGAEASPNTSAAKPASSTPLRSRSSAMKEKESTASPKRRGIFSAQKARPSAWGSDFDPTIPLVVETLTIIFLFIILLQDLLVFGFGSSNGRALSFIDSFSNCYSFRNQLPLSPVRKEDRRLDFEIKKEKVYHIGHRRHSHRWRARTLVMCFLLKYGSSTVVSVLLRTTPVFLKGPRHVLTFLVALVTVQFFPGDIPFKVVHRSPWFQLVIALCTSFYKLRKLIYVVKVFSGAETILGSLPPLLGLAVIALDGNALARRLENVLSHRGIRSSTWKQFGKEVLRAMRFFWCRNSNLLLATCALHLTSSTCLTVQSHARNAVLQVVACNLHLAAQVAALLIFMERTRIWKARSGESLLWQIASGKALLLPWIDQWI